MEEFIYNLYSITSLYIMEGKENDHGSIDNIFEIPNKIEKKLKSSFKKHVSSPSLQEQQTFLKNSTSNQPFKEESQKMMRTRKKNVLIQKKDLGSKEQLYYAEKQETFEKCTYSVGEANRNLSAIHRYLLKDHSSIINKNYLSRLYSGVEYALKRLKPPSTVFIQNNQKLLKEDTNSKKKFLFLDLDETLIKTKQVQSSQKTGSSYRLLIRPYTFTFLEELSQYYEIYVFTAATKVYAQGVINRLNRDKAIIKDNLSRDNCYLTKKGHHIKDLRIVKNRELKDIVIIDNTVEAFGLNINNGIPILDFFGQQGDKQLLKLLPFLKSLSQVEDVRPVIKKKFNLSGILDIKKKDLDFYFESLWN